MKNKTEGTLFQASQSLIRDMTSHFEIYQAYQPDYDIFDVANQNEIVLFTEKFEHQVEELEDKMAKIARGQYPYALAQSEGKLN